MEKKINIKTRLAPSPTGMLHIGSLRTALYNYLFARQNKGEFLLRIEDTDQARKVAGATEKIFEILNWAGLHWDNEPIQQSSRLKIYAEYARHLIEQDKAYYCFCTPQRLEQMREQQQAKKLPPRYDGACRHLSAVEVEKKLTAKTPHVVRLKVPSNQEIIFSDLVYGDIKYNSSEIDDQVLMKSDGYPTYHLAVVIDDHEMNITHIMRGEEWLPSTPKHILLYNAFGWDKPQFMHLPNILGDNKKKLSKRTGDVSVEEFKNKGYLPEALINYIALLGWNPGTEQEIFSLPELTAAFDVKKIHKAGAIFDYKKLDNINSQYIKKLKVDSLVNLCRPYLEKTYDLQNYNDLYIDKVVALEQDRLKKISDIVENTRLFFAFSFDYDADLLIWKKSNKLSAKNNLQSLTELLEKLNPADMKSLETVISEYIITANLSVGEVLWPLRVSLSGDRNSPGPFVIADILGKEETLRRIRVAIEKLS